MCHCHSHLVFTPASTVGESVPCEFSSYKITFFSSVFSDFSEIMDKFNDSGPIISSDEESKGKFNQIQDLFSKLYLIITVHFKKKHNLLVKSHIVVWCKQKVKL